MKSEFLSPLVFEDVSDGKKVLVRDLVYFSERLGRTVDVPAGFETDLASVPRLPFAYLLFGGTADKAAVVHDFLYRKSGVPQADADAVFMEAMEASGHGWFRRWSMYAGLRAFGWTSYQDINQKGQCDEEPDPYRDVRGS